jgi:hypothetical protein
MFNVFKYILYNFLHQCHQPVAAIMNMNTFATLRPARARFLSKNPATQVD